MPVTGITAIFSFTSPSIRTDCSIPCEREKPLPSAENASRYKLSVIDKPKTAVASVVKTIRAKLRCGRNIPGGIIIGGGYIMGRVILCLGGGGGLSGGALR